MKDVKNGTRRLWRAGDQKTYSLGVDLGTEGGDHSAYVVMSRDPVSDAITVVAARSFPAIGKDARRIIREDLEAIGFRVIDAGGPES